jgi:hypothetical protein
LKVLILQSRRFGLFEHYFLFVPAGIIKLI